MKNSFKIFFFAILLPVLSFSQSNNPAPVCVGDYSFGCGQAYLNGITTSGAGTNIINPSSYCTNYPNGYIYYCNNFISANPGQTISVSANCGGFILAGLAVFVDWNLDNTFTVPTETIYMSSGYAFPVTNFTFAIPSLQPVGKYRLRFRYVSQVIGTAINPCGTLNDGETEDYDIYVGSGPASPNYAVASPSNICNGQSSTLTAYGAGTFSWSTGQTGSLVIVSPTISTNYTCTINSNTCPIIRSIFVTGPISLTATSNPSTTCAGQSATIYVSGASNFTWSSGQTQTSYIIVTPTVSPTYTITGTVGPCSASVVYTHTVFPVPNLSVASSGSICEGGFYSAILSASGAPSYLWSNGSSSSSIAVSPSVTTIYTVTGIMGSCTSSATVTQSVVNGPGITATSSSSIICAGSSATLIGNGADNYTWFAVGLSPPYFSPTFVITPTVTTTYTLQGAIIGSLCPSYVMITQSVVICNSIDGSISASDQIVYPNPFSNEIRIKTNGNFELIVYDVFGKIIFREEADTELKIETQEWNRGVYFLSIKNNSGIKTLLLIKN
jgi:hypothetical protein